MTERVTLFIDAVAFEDRCVVTDRPAETVCSLEIEHGLDLVLVSFTRALVVEVPVTQAIKRKHTRVFYGLGLLLLSVIVGLVGVAALLSPGEPLWVVLPCLALLWFGRNRLPTLVDRLVLGIWGVRFSEEGGVVILGVTRPELAERARRCVGRRAVRRPHTRFEA